MSRCSSWSASNTLATAPTVSGEASSRNVCPVGAVSTTIRSEPRPRQPRDLEQPDEFVDPGNRQVEQLLDILAIEPGSVLEDVAERAAMLAQPAGEGAPRVEFAARAVAARRMRPRHRRERTAERVAQRMRGIGRDARAPACRAPPPQIARAAAHVVLPTPPFPPKKTNNGWRLRSSAWRKGAWRRLSGSVFGLEAFDLDAADLVVRRHGETGLAAGL